MYVLATHELKVVSAESLGNFCRIFYSSRKFRNLLVVHAPATKEVKDVCVAGNVDCSLIESRSYTDFENYRKTNFC